MTPELRKMAEDNHPRFKHGETIGKKTPLYRLWCWMRGRCKDKKNMAYGGRGIAVCVEWDDYSVFKSWALENGYTPGLEIDREDVNAGYGPHNCRFVTRKVQANNRTDNHFVAFMGERMTIAQWAERMKISATAIEGRLNRLGWPVEKALTKPVQIRAKYGIK